MSEPVIEPGMTPGQRIKLYRQRRGMSQKTLAELVGVHIKTVTKWERDERQITALSTWIQIARALNVRDLYRLTGMPVNQLPDEPSEHYTVPPIRAALWSYNAPPTHPSLDQMISALEFAWGTWHGSPSRFSRTGPMLPDLILEARALVKDTPTPDAYRVLADLYMLTRAYSRRVGAPDLAQLAAERAMVAAHNAGDPDLIAAATWNTCTVLGNRGSTELAIDLAADAISALKETTGDTNPTGRRLAITGALHLVLAIQHARIGDEREAITALDTAAAAAAVTGETNHYHLVFGPTNVDIHRANVALELSRAAEARRIAERIDPDPLPSIERRFTHYLSLGTAYNQERVDLAAVTMLRRAYDESAEEAALNPVFRGAVREQLTRETPTTRPTLRPLADALGIT